MALGRSPEYHWNQIISKSVHRVSRKSRLSFFLFIALVAILLNRAEWFEHFLYPRFEKVGGILVYICPSFRPSFRPSVLP